MMSKIHIDRKKLSTQFGSIGLLSVFLFSLLISLLPVRVSAVDPPLNSPTQEAAIYQTMHFLMACGERNGWHSGGGDSISSDKLNEGRLFDEGQGAGATFSGQEVAIGFLAERNKENGFGACTFFQNGIFVQAAPDVTAACDTIGVKCTDLVVDAGIYFNDTEDGGGYDVYNESNEARSVKLLNYFKKRYPGMKLDGDMNDASKYFNLKATFLKKCADGEPKKGGTAKVQVVDDSGKNESLEYNLKSGSGELQPVGFGIGNDNHEQKYTCDEIIKGMNATAGAAEKAQKDFKSKGGQETPGVGNEENGTKPNCEQNAKVSMGWVLCGVLDAIDSILIGDHGLLAITENLLNVNSKQYDNSQLKQSWSYFKNIATFLLILIGLVMIIGQAVSKE